MIRPGQKWTVEAEAARLRHWRWIDTLNTFRWFAPVEGIEAIELGRAA